MVYGSGQGQFALPFLPLISKNVTLHFLMVYHLAAADRARAQRLLTGYLERGELEHVVAERLPLADIVRAHELVEQGRVVGNVVLDID